MDKINFVTVENLIQENKIKRPETKNLFGYEGERAEEFNKFDTLVENDYNWEEDPNLSLADKIAIIEDAIDYNHKKVKSSRREGLFSKNLQVA